MHFGKKLGMFIVVPTVIAATVAVSSVALVSAQTQTPTQTAPAKPRAGTLGERAHKLAPHRGGPAFGRPHGLLEAVAQATGLTRAEIGTQLKAGQTLESIITSHKATVEQVAGIVVKQSSERLAAQVKSGKLTQAQADEMTAKLHDAIVKAITTPPPARPKLAPNTTKPAPNVKPFGPGVGGMPMFAQVYEVLNQTAKALGMTPAEVMKEYQSGKSINDILTEHGKTGADVKTALLDAAKTRLDMSVKSGRMTQAQEDEVIAKLGTMIDKALSEAGETPPAPKAGERRPAAHPFRHGPSKPNAPATAVQS